MADLSFIPALIDVGYTGSVSDYNKLENRPVLNINGVGIVICKLQTGVYNIDGTWKLTDDDLEHETLADDLFYVLNDGSKTKLTLISAGHIMKYVVPNDGTVKDVTEEEMATVDKVIKNLIGSF